MAVSVLHATPADASFSPSGKTHWNANHNITGLANAVAFFDSAGSLADSANLTFNGTSTLRLGGATAGINFSADGNAIYFDAIAGSTTFNWRRNSTLIAVLGGAAAGTFTAGAGMYITAGTAVAAGIAAHSITRTNNHANVDTGVKWTFTDTTSAAGFLPFQILGGAAGTTNLLSVGKAGELTAAGGITSSGGVTAATTFNFSATGTILQSGAAGVVRLNDGGSKNVYLTTVADNVLGVNSSAAQGASATISAAAYIAGGDPGVDFNGAITNLTIVKGIVTAAS